MWKGPLVSKLFLFLNTEGVGQKPVDFLSTTQNVLNNIQHRKAFLPLIGFILDIVGIGMGFFFNLFTFFFSGGAAFMDLDKYVERNFLAVFSRLHSPYVYLPLQPGPGVRI